MTKKSALLLALSSALTLQLIVAVLAIAQTTSANPAGDVPVNLENIKNEGFTIVPAEPNAINGREFIFEVKPGEETRDSVMVRNLSDTETLFYLYGADPTVSAQGTPAYKTRDTESNEEGKWITFDHSQVVLGPNEDRKEYFTLRVPADAEPGEYRAGIAIEKTKKDSQNANITIATRVILHSKITVSENPSPVPKAAAPVLSGSDTKNQWQIYYFWISLILFLGSFAALIWVTYQEKKAGRVAQTTTAHRASPIKPAVKPATPKRATSHRRKPATRRSHPKKS
ncbi:DUF916 domain-containing protein [Patescibacteria group bacterium]|nr:DUF916 domain-containing protein [Patescibacteria group bacterium]